MGSVPGDSEFSSEKFDPPMSSDFGPMRQDLGYIPKSRPEFGSLGNIGSSDSGFSPRPGPLGSLRQDLGSVPKLEMAHR